MSAQVLVVSELLSKENHEQVLFDSFKKLARLTLENENGCIAIQKFYPSLKSRQRQSSTIAVFLFSIYSLKKFVT